MCSQLKTIYMPAFLHTLGRLLADLQKPDRALIFIFVFIVSLVFLLSSPLPSSPLLSPPLPFSLSSFPVNYLYLISPSPAWGEEAIYTLPTFPPL